MRINNKLLKAALAIMLVCIQGAASAQYSSINTFSPYSFYGIGDISVQGNSASMAMGATGLGYRSPRVINSLNPASYSSIARQTALLHVGLEGKNVYLSTNDAKSSFNTFNIRDLGFQIPIAKGVGFTFSMSPYSTVGYRISRLEESNDVWEDIGSVSYRYSGSGGVNQVKAGFGWAVTDWLSVGAEAIYYFGNIQRNFTQTLNSITGSGYYLGVNSDNQEHISKVFANIGIQARLMQNNNNESLILGATYTMGGNLNSRVSEVVMHGPYFVINGMDPVVNNNYRSDFKMPHRVGAGLYYNKPKFSAGLDYYYTGWGANSSGYSLVEYRNTHTVNAGVEFIPNPGDVRKMLKRWSYRLGARYDQYYMTFDGKNINEAAITMGVGIPLGARSVNSMNIGLELGTRGTKSNNLVQEGFFKISLGISLFGDDYWFVKYKYN